MLVALPAGFDPRKSAAIVVFFHGNNATLQRDVLARQDVLGQLHASRLNAALIAPQFAVDALDSSAGRFWVPGAFARFMGEAAFALAKLGKRSARASFAGLPILLVAYSGGYDPTAYALAVGGRPRRDHAAEASRPDALECVWLFQPIRKTTNPVYALEDRIPQGRLQANQACWTGAGRRLERSTTPTRSQMFPTRGHP